MLDDHRRKAVAAVGDFGHRASLPSASFPSYPVNVNLTKRLGRLSMILGAGRLHYVGRFHVEELS
jgi:hypothetical protein